MKKLLQKGGLVLAAVAAPVAAFAQTTSTGTPAIDDAGIVASISSTSTTVQDVGIAVLGVVVVVFAFRLIKGFIGR
jgi:hypothetical protein